MNAISLIIITYNRAEELKVTLNLLEKQEAPTQWEVLVIDQNSSDHTKAVCEKSHLNNLRYYKLDKNLGVAGGRNAGAKLSNFENLVFLDDDANFSSNTFLKDLGDYMEKSEYNIFAFQIRDLNYELYHWPYGKTKLENVDLSFDCNKFIGCGHAIKKNLFVRLGGYSNDMFFGFEETELVMKNFAVAELPVRYEGSFQVIHRVTNTNRIIAGDRYYYKVRNRLYVLRELAPFGGGFNFVAYGVVYLLKSIRYGYLTSCICGIIDALKADVDKEYRMSVKEYMRYLSYGR